MFVDDGIDTVEGKVPAVRRLACAAAGRSEKSAGRPRADALVGHPTAILRPAGSDVHRKHPRRCNRQANFRDGQRVETGTGFAREAGCLFRIPFEVSALQPRRRITPPLRKALLVQIGGPQCTVGQTQRPPSNSVSGCGSSAAARLDALCGQPPALTSVHSFSTYTQLSTGPESHGATRSRGLRARKTTADSPTASTNAKNTPFDGVTSASRRVHKASDADKRSIDILDRGILS